MSWPDVALLAVIALSASFSLFRGFVREVFSLIGWIVSFWLASRFAGVLADQLEGVISYDDVRAGVAFLLLFCGVLIASMVVNHLLVKIVRASGLGAADRSLGAVFGLLRGIVIVTVFTMFAAMTPLTTDEAWQRSVVAGYVGHMAAWAAQFMPQDVAERVQAGLRG